MITPTDSAGTPVTDEIWRPEHSAVDWAIAALLSLATIAYLFPALRYSGLGNDEAIAFQGAVRILNGQLPYRDFFSFYTPGSYYLYAAVFRVFGTSFVAARSLLLVYSTIFAALTYLLARRTASRSVSAFITVLLTLVALPSRFQNLHNWDSTASALCAVYCLTRALESSSTRWALLAGIFAGCTAMIDQAKGAGIMIGFFLCAGILFARERSGSLRNIFAVLAVGGTLPVIATVLYFAAHRSLRALIDGALWPLHHYTGVNQLPYGYLYWRDALPLLLGSGTRAEHAIVWLIFSAGCVVSLLPLLILPIFGKELLQRNRTPLWLARHIVVGGAVTLAMLLTTWKTGRPDYLRIVYLAPLFFYVLPLFADVRTTYLPSLRRWQPLISLSLLVSFIFLSVFLSLPAWTASQRVYTRRGMIRVPPPEEVIPYLQKNVSAGSKLMVYPYAANFSFFTATFNPTYYDFLQVGMHTPEDFARAQRELAADQTPAVLFDLTFRSYAADVWPSTPATALASDPLGDYILSHYRPCQVLHARKSIVLFMVRKDLSCPKS